MRYIAANHLRPREHRDSSLPRHGTAVLPTLSSLRGDASIDDVIIWASTHVAKERFKAYVNWGVAGPFNKPLGFDFSDP
ncbi:hypothetical protein CEP52_002791 [Fusarium oligoseptatum]|uniref:Uncharacterized protein n=1 Tax=Fusarium oligoseptatum TaxID=2604345 RepID=A0A428UCS0_9HYPO|nr:hypothetical protein CEP52_002791 [Fusarium oligoseptatum]